VPRFIESPRCPAEPEPNGCGPHPRPYLGVDLRFLPSGRADSNRRPLDPQSSALTKLRHGPSGSDSDITRLGVAGRDNWYEGHMPNLSSGTRRDYEGRIRRDVERIGSLEAGALRPRDCDLLRCVDPPPAPGGPCHPPTGLPGWPPFMVRSARPPSAPVAAYVCASMGHSVRHFVATQLLGHGLPVTQVG
jgi:hypothetical protein